MENIYIQYFIKVLLGSILFYLVYYIFLKKDTCFTLKRLYLILASLIPIIYPFVSVSVSSNSLERSVTLQTIVVTNDSLQVYLDQKSNWLSQYHFSDFVLLVWGLGAIVMLLFFFQKLYQLFRFYRSCHIIDQYKVQGCKVYEVDGCDTFSFFNTIFIGAVSATNKKEILAHELLHVRYKHSLEIVCSELIMILFWWNLVFRLIKEEMKVNHEFMVDDQMIREGVNKKEYQYLLLSEILQNSSISIINYFNVSQLKKRISMMNKIRTKKTGYAKYLVMFLIPMMLFAVNCKQQDESDIATTDDREAVTQAREDALNALSSTTENGEVYDFTETMPQFPGGQQQMMRWIAENLQYPAEAVENGKQGRVIVKFIVGKDGVISNPQVVKGVYPTLDEEAIRVINAMPQWTPGKQDNRDVAVNFTIPISFKLK